MTCLVLFQKNKEDLILNRINLSKQIAIEIKTIAYSKK
jgi:hypothetical protein